MFFRKLSQRLHGRLGVPGQSRKEATMVIQKMDKGGLASGRTSKNETRLGVWIGHNG